MSEQTEDIDWLHEVLTELQHREDYYRSRRDDDDYWRPVANGISEAIDVLEECQEKRQRRVIGADTEDADA